MASEALGGVAVVVLGNHEMLRGILSEFLIQKGAKVSIRVNASQAGDH